jgi:MFS family permease
VLLLFATRFARMFGYGLVSIILVLYLTRLGLDERRSGLLLSLTLAGDLAISLWMTTRADRIGRRRILMMGAGLMCLAGLVFPLTVSFPVLLLAAIVGVISPSGNEVGPFLPVEQAAISQEITGPARTTLFAWYNLTGSIATALGALLAGWFLRLSTPLHGEAPLGAYRAVFFAYAGVGVLLVTAFSLVSSAVEVAPQDAKPPPMFLGLHKSRNIVLRLSALFALDAFAGGFALQTFMAYWFVLRFQANPDELGAIFFVSNLVSGLSGLVAAKLAARFGLINTMVFTHIPSNLLLIAVPLMPTYGLAITALILRFSISQMDVPTRQSYVASVVSPDERAAAGGVTNVFRSLGTMCSPLLAGMLLARPGLISVPFFLAGGLKIVYDLVLLAMFRRHQGESP